MTASVMPWPARPKPKACELCGREDARRLVLEHCHDHNQFRGWTCDRCNALLRSVDRGWRRAGTWAWAGDGILAYWRGCYRCARRKTGDNL